jgi:hypothetical protein
MKKADIIKSDIFDAVKTVIEVNTISTKIYSLWDNFQQNVPRAYRKTCTIQNGISQIQPCMD